MTDSETGGSEVEVKGSSLSSVPEQNVHDSALWRGGLARANRRITTLTQEVSKLERTSRAGLEQIAGLELILARLREANLNLEKRIAELVRENDAARVGNQLKDRQIASLGRSVNRLQNERFWSICHFIAGASNFHEYAKTVNYDLVRLFCMLLAEEINSAAELSPEIRRHALTIANIFDPFFYLAEYSDVALTGVNPLLHYVTNGYREGRRPSPLFDGEYYAARAKLTSEDPLLHYVNKGVYDGQKPHPLFDGNFYWEQYPDVGKQKVNPLFHYQTWGARERRDPSILFDTEHYLKTRNLPTPIENPLAEYLSRVLEQTVEPHPLFLSSYFCERAELLDLSEPALVVYEKRPDLHDNIAPHPLFNLDYLRDQLGIEFGGGISPLEAFCRLSRERDIDPSLLFDSKLYRYQMQVEMRNSFSGSPILHYLKEGYHVKALMPNLLFDPETYLERNRIDVVGPELTHYCVAGDQQGYYTHPLFSARVYNALRTDTNQITALEHFLSCSPADRRLSHPHFTRPLPTAMLDFVRRVYADDSEFDSEFYCELYPDVKSLNHLQAKQHYVEHGRSEGRVGSPRSLVRKYRKRVRDLPLGFFADEYLELNPDLAANIKASTPASLFRHYLEFGLREKRKLGRWQYQLETLSLHAPTAIAPISITHDSPRVDIAVIMHLFYPDLWPDLAAFVRNFQQLSTDVFINVVDEAWTPQFHRQVRELCPGAFLQLSNNSGRDIGAFIRLLDHIEISKYRLFAWVHSKRSPHLSAETGDYWRRSLLQAFAGSEGVVKECIELFNEDPSVGLIAAKEWRATEMGGRNEVQFERMLDLFEIDKSHRNIEYVSGTMFLVRSDIVLRLYNKLKEFEWEYGGGKDLSFHVDGQIAHAVERVVGNLVRQMGYRMVWR